jgi:hypothetical protein
LANDIIPNEELDEKGNELRIIGGQNHNLEDFSTI